MWVAVGCLRTACFDFKSLVGPRGDARWGWDGEGRVAHMPPAAVGVMSDAIIIIPA